MSDLTVFDVKRTLSKVEIAAWYRNVEWNVQDFRYSVADGPNIIARFRIEYDEPDVDTGKMERQLARWWYVDEQFTEESLIKSAWAALTMSDEHRRREAFIFEGQRIFSPHNPLSKLEKILS